MNQAMLIGLLIAGPSLPLSSDISLQKLLPPLPKVVQVSGAISLKDVLQLGRLEDRKDRKNLAYDFAMFRYRIQEQLLLQLEAPKNQHHEICLVYLLGRYRMEAAAEPLAKRITLMREFNVLDDSENVWIFPAAEALIRIGQASIPYMLKNITDHKDEKARKFSALVIRDIVGSEVAKFIVASKMKKETDPVKRARLKEASGVVPSKEDLFWKDP